MIGKLVKIQLIVFVVVGLVALVYVGAKYARLDKLAGVGMYTVTAKLPDSGGIFTNAEVTYQGVPVGRVGKLTLTPDGVDVALDIDSGGPEIPASATAVVANRSAIGEQFVDLQPTSSEGPYLKGGDTITKYVLPEPLEDVVASAIDFTDSIPVDDLNTVITELGNAFNGQGENLTRLVDSLGKLSRAGVDNLSETVALIQNSNVVLDTQADQSDAILTWSRNLNLVTATLASADPDLRRLLTTGTLSATQISELIQKNGNDLSKVVKDLAEVARTIEPATYTTSTTFAMLSALSAGSHAPAPGDGQIHFGVVLETNNPAACTRGYESTDAVLAEARRQNPDFDVHYDDFAFNTEAKCTVPFGNPTGVRSAERAQYANPAYPQPWDNTPKKDPDKLNLNPLAQQLAALLGVRPR
ncbi:MULTISPECIES: MCE family protein [unclassified Gordonia (in: high G+C Gram-positive bacteria)]|uniref:MCE family protein n=1 Tax=unclassified Gordonia (in: high G+C Gram-positive bacteria) TaxID=2657482 RepID=UPI00071D6EE1|nr:MULTISPECIES: MlaD family protein [unclassified Gordonia (in: high G+C Gram-positive bacteria)]KSU55046.1 mammalian cell entry protein [Gordonia sp. SGD-V-85]MCT1354719.1 MCE family protein [Gordonia sp. p3-SID1431]SCC51828.1 phospholipid/cholesterol/gamma-HCH transport system substrate-binding protein [Gordonia sp. v-85]